MSPVISTRCRGETSVFRLQELFDQVKVILANHRDIAMQYSPNIGFHHSLVDGGTIV